LIPLGKTTEQILGIAALLLLTIGCFVVLRPFLSALLWAAVICFSTWPIYLWCERTLGGRRGAAAALMTLLVGLLLIAPLVVMVATLADNVSRILTTATRVLEQGPPSPPRWVADLPLVGDSLAAYWATLAHNAPAFLEELKTLIGPATDIAVAGGAMLGAGLLELALSLLIAFFFYRHGRKMATYVRQASERFAGERARRLLRVVRGTVRGVVYGLIGTALAQAILAGIGFWIAGVPQALMLSFLIFFLSFLPVGPPLVWGGAAVWLLVQGDVWWGIFMGVWGLLLVSSVDNVLRPYFLGKTSDLPVILGFFGLLGGVLAFGFIGVFLGPTLLALGYSLFREWNAAEVEESAHPTSPASSDAQ